MSTSGQSIPLLLSMPQPCSYLPEQSSSSAFIDPDCGMDMDLYGRLIQHGFRRSGRLVYRPHCAECQQCLSLRIPVRDFIPRRRHRRILKTNKHIRVVPGNARFQQAHYELFQQYTQTRHPDGGMAESSAEQYMDFLSSEWSETLFLEMREGDRLMGLAVTDQVSDGLSAVYTFFSPDLPERSLGVYAVLSQISLARQLDLAYLYLGYWIRDCNKMSYKADYRPMQVFSDGRWRQFGVAETVVLPELPTVHP